MALISKAMLKKGADMSSKLDNFLVDFCKKSGALNCFFSSNQRFSGYPISYRKNTKKKRHSDNLWTIWLASELQGHGASA